MFKRKLGLLFCLLVLFSCLGCVSAQQADIGQIYVRFCNTNPNTESLSLVLDAGIESEICLNFFNQSDSDAVINYSFIDGTVTNDAYKSKACKNEGEIDDFGQYVRQLVNEITIPAGDVVQQKAYVRFPAGLSGMKNGCLTYYVADSVQELSGEMFSILVRKASFIDVLLGGKINRGLKLVDGSPFDYTFDKKNNKLIVGVSVNNYGNVSEQILIDGTISNILGYNAKFTGSGKSLGDEQTVLNMEISDIPRYGLFYKLDFTINSVGIFDFDDSSLPDDIKSAIVITAQTPIFLFPWLLVYVLLGFIVLIFLIRFLSKHLKFQK